MDTTLSQRATTTLFSILTGCCLIMVCSLIKIPFYPVPITMHTFAIFVLGLTQPPRTAFGSALLYLMIGTMNPLWIIGKCGGYYLSFPIAAYVISATAKKISPYLAIFCGQCVIYLLGFLWLAPFVGVRIAFVKGVVFFIPSAIIKTFLAVKVVRAK